MEFKQTPFLKYNQIILFWKNLFYTLYVLDIYLHRHLKSFLFKMKTIIIISNLSCLLWENLGQIFGQQFYHLELFLLSVEETKNLTMINIVFWV